MKNGIIRVQASAGSGKTYNLSKRYVELLAGICDEASVGDPPAPHACIPMDGKAGDPASLLAITFTNKAAAEMKERILLFLKRIAFHDLPESDRQRDFPFLSSGQAFQLLTRVIREFGRFNVKTIDAFMHSILKSFSVDLGLLPDFRLSLKTDDIHDMAMEELFEQGRSEMRVLEDLVLRECELFDAKGFDAEGIVCRAVRRLRDHDVETEELPPGQGRELDQNKKTLVTDAIHWLESVMQAADGVLNRRIFQQERDRDKLEQGKWPGWIQGDYTLREKLKKGTELPEAERFQRELDSLRKRWCRFKLEEAVVAMKSGVSVYRDVGRREAELTRKLNRFEIREMAESIQKMLASLGASAAFCRLGEQYVHYLIDEFQDTSRSQWNALAPLVGNSLAAGGSLYLVGDTKQAIYGWRGGDYRLFEDVVGREPQSDLTGVVDSVPDSNLVQHSLAHNFRSREEIVSFNNRVFQSLAAGSVTLSEGVGTLKQIYGNVEQKPAGKKGGYIQVDRWLEGDKSEAARTWMMENVASLLDRKDPGDILVLARQTKEVREIASWLAEMEIPFVTEDSLKLYGNSSVKSLLNLFAYLVLPDGDFHLSGVIENGWFGRLDPATTASVLVRRQQGREGGPESENWAQWMEREEPDLHERLVVPLRAARLAGSAYEQVSELVRQLDLLSGPDGVFVQRFLEQVWSLEEEGTIDPAQVVRTQFDRLSETVLAMPVHHGAIRVMTIHKAKGLESPVVMLPFTEWELTHNRAAIIGRTEEGYTVRITSDLAACDATLDRTYREYRTRETVESINMLYVALTRASDELYVLVPETKSGIAGTAGAVLNQMLLQAGLLHADEAGGRWGAPVKGNPFKGEKSASPVIQLVRATDRLIVQDRTDDRFQDVGGRMRGTLFHEALRGIHRISDDDPDLDALAAGSLRRAAARLGFHETVLKIEPLVPLMAETLQLLLPWFTGSLKAWNEKELVLGDGSIIRVDRLVYKANVWTILDYKTGHPEAVHHKQLKRYARALGEIGVTPELVLVYLDQGEVVHVR